MERWGGLQSEADAALGVLVDRALEIELIEIDGAVAAVADAIVELAASEPIVGGGKRGAVLHVEKNGGSGLGDIAGERIGIGSALGFEL